MLMHHSFSRKAFVIPEKENCDFPIMLKEVMVFFDKGKLMVLILLDFPRKPLPMLTIKNNF